MAIGSLGLASSQPPSAEDTQPPSKECQREMRSADSNPCCSWLDDAIAYSVANECRGRREVELAHDGSAVRLNGLEADVQEIGDLLVGVALGDELHDTAFPMRESRSLPCGT